MKTENTLENKAKFFAQYWGCKVLKNELLNPNIPAHKISFDNCRGSNEQYLELKSNLKVTDSDASELGTFLLENPHIEYSSYYREFLRSKGYALSFHDLSVEDLISYGWIKLNEQ